MKRKFIAFICFLCLSITIIAMAGCSNTIKRITDMERFADMQETTDSIDVEFDNHTGKPFTFTIEDENVIAEIMNIVLTEELTYIGNEPTDGDLTSITIHQGEKAYRLSVGINSEKDNYYSFTTGKLQSKIIDLAIAQGAYDMEVGVIYKVIDLQDIESVEEEKISVADKAAMLALLKNGYGDCEYFYLFDSENLAEQYYSSGIAENTAYQSTVTTGKGKLLVIYHIFQNYNAESYYITSPSLGEYVDNGNTMYIELTFGLWHKYNLHIRVVS